MQMAGERILEWCKENNTNEFLTGDALTEMTKIGFSESTAKNAVQWLKQNAKTTLLKHGSYRVIE